ncbi:MAG: DUF4197 domain-containing protein [Pseudomonadota bacterium]
MPRTQYSINKRRIILVSLSMIFFYTGTAQTGWQDNILKQAESYLNNGNTPSSLTKSAGNLSNSDISTGLKQALDIGIKKAVQVLGKKDGFLSDQAVKILIPEKLQKVDKLLRAIGQGKIADDFILSMNRAAENAVPHVTEVFIESIQKMSISDAQQILTGPDNAATEYFKKNTSQQLQKLIKPYVQKSMEKVDVTQYYESMLGMAKKYDSFGLLKQYLGADSGSLENFVTDKTLSGLFSKIALQEKAIRDNPALRSTDLLKKVFAGI